MCTKRFDFSVQDSEYVQDLTSVCMYFHDKKKRVHHDLNVARDVQVFCMLNGFTIFTPDYKTCASCSLHLIYLGSSRTSIIYWCIMLVEC